MCDRPFAVGRVITRVSTLLLGEVRAGTVRKDDELSVAAADDEDTAPRRRQRLDRTANRGLEGGVRAVEPTHLISQRRHGAAAGYGAQPLLDLHRHRFLAVAVADVALRPRADLVRQVTVPENTAHELCGVVDPGLSPDGAPPVRADR